MDNEFYKQLITQSPFGYAYHKIILDQDGAPTDYLFLEINPAFEKLTGLHHENVIDKKITEVIPTIKESEFDWIGYYGHIALTGEEKNFEQFSSQLNCWYKVNVYSPEKYYFVTIFTDITSEKKQQEKFRALFDAMTEMVVLHEIVFDDNNEPINYRIIDCNTAFSRITGIGRETVKGKLATEVYQTNKAPYIEEYAKVGITGKPYEFYTYYPAMDKHFMISVVSPEIGQFATITTDITGIKQTEELIQAKNKELENYLYIASHDLRSPLVNIQGFSSRITKQIESLQAQFKDLDIPEQSFEKISSILCTGIPKSLSFIFANVSQMDTLIKGLLTISRTGRVKMVVQQIDMNELIRKVLSSYNYQIEEAKAIINVSQLPHCFGDVNLLNQLFSNLIHNSLKYRRPETPIVINIKGNQKNKRVTYSIEDNGIGIDEINQMKIWDVFYRVNPQTNESGDGIGLNLSAKIVEKHKGKIWVESIPGKGSIFYIELLETEFAE
ncbi:MAG: ATP-binding protein [Ignavibacteria bacterium]|jgi:PAS domain S-box-containing protein|nr:ATP-binding protein [Ignavibacteria bacterium]